MKLIHSDTQTWLVGRCHARAQYMPVEKKKTGWAVRVKAGSPDENACIEKAANSWSSGSRSYTLALVSKPDPCAFLLETNLYPRVPVSQHPRISYPLASLQSPFPPVIL